MKQLTKPGMFSKFAAADIERANFDKRNEELLYLGVKPDAVFIGDSITQFWDMPLYLGGDEKLIVNRGIGGDITENVLKRFEADVLQLEPRACICMAGINDAHELLALPDTEESNRLVIGHTIANLGQIIKLAKAKRIPLALCSITPSNCPADAALEDRRNRMVPELNRELKTLCDEEKIPYVDYYSAMVMQGTLKMNADYTRDGIHPNANGYTAMTKVLSSKLKGWCKLFT